MTAEGEGSHAVAVRPLTVLPRDERVLRARARKIRRIDDSTRRLVEDLIDSMHAAGGVGLAAPQIGVSLRVIVIGLPGQPPFAMINPEIVKASGERRILEGCLSVPGYRGEVTRSVKVLVKGMDLQGREIRIRAEGDLLAQALEHEINHVNGVVYIDDVAEADDLYRLSELEELGPDADAASEPNGSAQGDAPDEREAAGG